MGRAVSDSRGTGPGENTHPTNRIAESALLLITVIWGTTFPLLRVSLQKITPYDIIALRFTIAAVLLAAIYWRRLGRMGPVAVWDGVRTGL
ncbi:MAG: EamA family transporter, partial [Vicinamibacteria bacterium]